MQTQKGKLELGKEYISPDENKIIKVIENIGLQQIEQNFKQGEKPVRRDAHAKHHGCVKAEFVVETNLPDEMKVGVFKEPSKRFTACIRFSNASGNAKVPDSKDISRGIAIKLLGVEGEKLLEDEKHEKTQDFVMINHPVFFIQNNSDYVEFFKALQEAGDKPPLKFFFPTLNPFSWRLHEFAITRAMRSNKVINPLTTQYWSTTPYKFGSRAMKFSAQPSSAMNLNQPNLNSENYLREAMVEHLKTNEASFDFLVQLQTDAEKMPIEDSRIEWKSPYYKLATIKIPPQTFDSTEQMEFCEHLSYTPWHSLPEHQPLGGINRARKQVYQSISELRHKLNNVPRREPTEAEFSSRFGHL